MENKMNMAGVGSHKPVIAGVFSGVVLFVFYFGINSLTASVEHAIIQLTIYWYLIIPLAIGFGIQVGLFMFVRSSNICHAQAGRMVTASGGVSTGSMVACCAHHVTDVLPFLGLSAFATTLSNYTPLLLLVGVLSNMVGITMMLEISQNAGIRTGIFERLDRVNMRVVKYAVIVIAVLIFAIAYILYKPDDSLTLFEKEFLSR